MNRPELTPYHRHLAEKLSSEPDRLKRTKILALERTTGRYKHAREHAKTLVFSSPIKPLLPKDAWYLSSPDETLVDVVLDRTFESLTVQNQVINWAEEAFVKYRKLSNKTVGQRKETKKFLRDTAGELLKNVQYIDIVDEKWRREEARGSGGSDSVESQESFSNLVKKECLAFIKEKWEDVKPEQLAQLVRFYTNNGPHQDFAKEMLSNYFNGPPNRCYPRVVAYYNFVSATLDLLGEDEAFREGMKIALYATDILPKNPSFGEQLNLISLPSKEEEKGGVFQKLLIIESVTKQAIFMSSQDFTEYFRDNEYFMKTDIDVKKGWRERKERVTRELGSPVVAEAKNNAVRAAMSAFFNFLTEPLSEERKQELMGTWPFNLAFDETDPLNQKFQKVKLQLATSS